MTKVLVPSKGRRELTLSEKAAGGGGLMPVWITWEWEAGQEPEVLLKKYCIKFKMSVGHPRSSLSLV